MHAFPLVVPVCEWSWIVLFPILVVYFHIKWHAGAYSLVFYSPYPCFSWLVPTNLSPFTLRSLLNTRELRVWAQRRFHPFVVFSKHVSFLLYLTLPACFTPSTSLIRISCRWKGFLCQSEKEGKCLMAAAEWRFPLNAMKVCRKRNTLLQLSHTRHIQV